MSVSMGVCVIFWYVSMLGSRCQWLKAEFEGGLWGAWSQMNTSTPLPFYC